MSHDQLSRRDFVRKAAAGSTLAMTAGALGAEEAAKGAEQNTASGPLPRRRLGKTGEQVSMLNLGTARGVSDRILDAAFAEGVRYFDLADCYQGGAAERDFGKWVTARGHRKDVFVVTKDHPTTPEEWIEMADRRIEASGIGYIDLFFIHMLGASRQPHPEQVDWPKDKAWAKAAAQMKKSGKVRFAGFSTHAPMDLRITSLNNAAESDWVEAVMVAVDPLLIRNDKALNEALDRCHKADIGLICMKEMRVVKEAPKDDPLFANSSLTPHQAVLHAIWSDGRFASICSHMPNLRILKENAQAARDFKPLTEEQHGRVLQLFQKYAGTFCPGCDGSCQQAAGTQAKLNDIVRYLAYYEQDGDREQARRLFAALSPEERDWHGADLTAAQHACRCHLDFDALLARAEQKLA